MSTKRNIVVWTATVCGDNTHTFVAASEEEMFALLLDAYPLDDPDPNAAYSVEEKYGVEVLTEQHTLRVTV